MATRKSVSDVLNEHFNPAALFCATSTAIGLVGGFTAGGITAVMTNRIETPMARPHILRSTRLFGLVGLVSGLVGAGVILVRGKDDYWSRAVSGCAGGAALGLARTLCF